MSSAQNILAYLIACSPRRFTRTELVKMVYLVDWGYLTQYGRQATSLEWIRDHYGPNAPSLMSVLDELKSSEQIIESEKPNNYGGAMYLYDRTDRTRLPELPYGLQRICDEVLALYGRLSLDEIKDAAYSTPPMKFILAQEQVEGCSMYGRALDLDRFAPKKRKRIARRAVELSTRGSESERCASNIVEFIVWENSIKKATNVGIGEDGRHGCKDRTK